MFVTQTTTPSQDLCTWGSWNYSSREVLHVNDYILLWWFMSRFNINRNLHTYDIPGKKPVGLWPLDKLVVYWERESSNSTLKSAVSAVRRGGKKVLGEHLIMNRDRKTAPRGEVNWASNRRARFQEMGERITFQESRILLLACLVPWLAGTSPPPCSIFLFPNIKPLDLRRGMRRASSIPLSIFSKKPEFFVSGRKNLHLQF